MSIESGAQHPELLEYTVVPERNLSEKLGPLRGLAYTRIIHRKEKSLFKSHTKFNIGDDARISLKAPYEMAVPF